MLTKLSQLLAQGRFVSPVPAVVVHPTTDIILQSCIQAHQHHIITPILVGPKHKIEKAATDANLAISGFTLVDAEHSHDAVEIAAKMVREQQADFIIKGSVHTLSLIHI